MRTYLMVDVKDYIKRVYNDENFTVCFVISEFDTWPDDVLKLIKDKYENWNTMGAVADVKRYLNLNSDKFTDALSWFIICDIKGIVLSNEIWYY